MKAQRRHELQQNVLDAKLANGAQFLKKHSNKISLAILVIAVLVFAVVYMIRSQTSAKARVQAEFEAVMANPGLGVDERAKRLADLAAQSTDEFIAAMAWVTLGNDSAAKAVLSAGRGSEDARRQFQLARDYYGKAAGYREHPLPVAMAHLGLAKLAEGQGDLARAREEYQRVVAMTQLADQPVVARAQESLKQLDTIKDPVVMATTVPAEESASQPTSAPTSGPAASQPASAPSR